MQAIPEPDQKQCKYIFKLHTGLLYPGSFRARRTPSSLLELLLMWVTSSTAKRALSFLIIIFECVYEKNITLISFPNHSQIKKSLKLPALIRHARKNLDKQRVNSPPEVSTKFQVTVPKYLHNLSPVQLPRTGCHPKLPACI